MDRTNIQQHNTQRAMVQAEGYVPEALFLNLSTQKMESLRPDQIAEPEQYLLLSDLLAE